MINAISKKILDLRPEPVNKRFGNKTNICLLSSKDILRVLRSHSGVIMAANIRIKHVIPGIMRAAQEMEAVVAFEIAKSESGIDGGYTGLHPFLFVDTIIDYAARLNFQMPFFIHGDHITVKNTKEEEIESARQLIAVEMNAGFTSFAIDASFNELEDNIRITKELAKPIFDCGYGLEVEVGEIKHTGTEAELTTPEEAIAFIKGLVDGGIQPDLLAINNGSKHGNYLKGEKISIDLKRTKKIYDLIKPYNVAIAQHGITGTPANIMAKFADHGIRKGNVGTEWQNIAHKGLPFNLLERMQKWAKENNKDIKFATKAFKGEIDEIPEENKKTIEQMAYEEACQLIKIFKMEGAANKVAKELSKEE